jgi:hypothetical protein
MPGWNSSRARPSEMCAWGMRLILVGRDGMFEVTEYRGQAPGNMQCQGRIIAGNDQLWNDQDCGETAEQEKVSSMQAQENKQQVGQGVYEQRKP